MAQLFRTHLSKFVLLALFHQLIQSSQTWSGQNQGQQRFGKSLEELIDLLSNQESSFAVTPIEANASPWQGTKKTCTCVPYYLCKEGRINTDGSGLIDLRFGFSSQSGKQTCPQSDDVCCENTDRPLVWPVTTPTRPPSHRHQACGHRNLNNLPIRISSHSDKTTKFGEFPWIVTLLRNTPRGLRYIGGGTLIHPQVILTAAHKIANIRSSEIVVRAGDWDLSSTRESLPHQNRYVSQKTLHPLFNRENGRNNIAIIYLSTPFTLDEHINVACLPPQDAEFPENFQCVTAGWGVDRHVADKSLRTVTHQNVLQKVTVPLVSTEKCEQALRTTRLGFFFKLGKSDICAGGDRNMDACTGDGGSPLMCPIVGTRNRYYQIGIVSWGVECGHKDIPGVYTNVAQFRNWIDSQLQLHNFDTSLYQAVPEQDNSGLADEFFRSSISRL